jgi:bla regulator protein BlaR1
MYFSSQLLNEAAVAACWTLVHSLWQGLLLVILTGLVMVSTRMSRPVVRYRLLSVLMVLFVTAAAMTFAREWRAAVAQRVAAQSPQPLKQAQERGQSPEQGQARGQGHEQAPAAGVVDVVVPAADDAGVAAEGGSSVGIPERVNVFLSEHAMLIVAIWLLILGVRLGRMCWAITYTRYIRRHQSQALPEYWTVRMNELSGRMGFRRPVLLLESAVMQMPVVFGHLKPVIFIPLGLFTKLSPEQAEAILLHELAHIKRDDYLMNLLQSVAVHLFFFNPAVLWLSALLREAREHCCDEMAIAGTGDKKPLVRALIGFRELSFGSGALYGMAFAGRRNVFVNRIARIVQGKSKGLTAGEGVFFGLSVLLVGFLAMAFKEGGRQKPGGGSAIVLASGLAEWHGWVIAADTLAPVVVGDTLAPLKNDSIPRKRGSRSGKGDGWSDKGGDHLDNGDAWSERDRLVSLDVDLAHGKQVIVAWYQGLLYHITQVNGEVTNLSVGDKPVPAGELAAYRNTIQRIYERLDRVRVDNEEPQLLSDSLKLENGELRLLSDTLGFGQGDRLQELLMQNKNQELANSELAKRLAELQVSQDFAKSDLAKKLADMSASQELANGDLAKRLAELQTEQQDTVWQYERLATEKALKEQELNFERAQKAFNQQQMGLERLKKDMLRDNSKLRAMMDEVVKKGIVDNIKQIHSMSLTKDAFIINGKKQPAAVHEAFVNEFVPDPEKDFHFEYSNK